ncbi:MAG: hypothetical protein ABIR70_06935 [Bryobacteraceae bacterium]
MTDTQILTIALATVPNILAVLAGILINNSRLTDLKSDMNTRLAELRTHMDSRFNSVDRRFDDMRDMWRSELHRVEEVLDARLKHLEER